MSVELCILNTRMNTNDESSFTVVGKQSMHITTLDKITPKTYIKEMNSYQDNTASLCFLSRRNNSPYTNHTNYTLKEFTLIKHTSHATSKF